MDSKAIIERTNHRCPAHFSGLVAALIALGSLGIGLPHTLADAGPEQVCAGDINGDGVVDADDLGILLGSFGCVGPDCAGDVNGDGVVDADDLGILLGSFGCVGEIIPAYNRGIESLDFSPGSMPGLWNVTATWYVESNETEIPRDLSTVVVTTINGVQVGEVFELATINAASGPCLGSPLPCDGSACGQWHFFFVSLDGFCLPSIAGAVGIDFCTCACVVITVALEDFPLNDGDIVGVELQPAPGSLPELVTGDDSLEVAFSTAGVTGACCRNPFGSGCVDGLTAAECADFFTSAEFHPGSTCAGLGCAPVVGNCCSPQPGPGCEDPECETLVCSLDPFCCDTAWDAICADLANEICPACAEDLTFLFEFEYNGEPQLIVPDVNDFLFLDFMFTLIDDRLSGPIVIIPIDSFGDPLPGDAGGIELPPGGSFAIAEPGAAAYLLMPPAIPGAVGIIEVKNFQVQAGNTINATCNELSAKTAIQSTNPPGANQVKVSGNFSVPPNTDDEFFCPIRVTIVVMQYDEDEEKWVPSGPAEQPDSPVIITPGDAQDIEVTILGGRRVVYTTQCLPPSGNKCQFNFSKANN